MTIMHHSGRDRSSEAFMERLYAYPRPNATREDWERQHHRDLPTLDDEALARERRRVQRRADHETDRKRGAWLTERLGAIDAEWRRRRPPQLQVDRHAPPGRRSAEQTIRVAGVDLPFRRASRGR
jgi:hypothetical protein